MHSRPSWTCEDDGFIKVIVQIFPKLDEVISEEPGVLPEINEDIMAHLENLKDHFQWK